LDFDDAITWNNNGILFHSQKMYEEAIASYDKAIALNPDEPIFQRNREKAMAKLQRLKTIKKNPNTSKKSVQIQDNINYNEAITWSNEGYRHAGKKNYAEALTAYIKAISLAPDEAIFWKNKAKALEALGECEAAKIAFAQSELLESQKHTINSSASIDWNNKGFSLAEQGLYNDAIAAFEQAIESNPDFAEAWNNKGYSQMELGQIDEAIESFQQAIRLKPEFADTWMRKWLLLTHLVRNEDIIPVLYENIKTEKTELSSEMPVRICNHVSGPVEMERVFMRSKNSKGEYIFCGWICPDCQQFQKG
jgi:tetratricopeptide (TPR) repeat protein